MAGELPYAWEESWDPVVGVYYIDHITQTHFNDPPWNESVMEQVIYLHSHLSNETERLNEQRLLETEKKIELEQVEERLHELEEEKKRIEGEIYAVSKGLGDGDSKLLKGELTQINERIEQEQADLNQISRDHQRLVDEVTVVQSRLLELNTANKKLESDNYELANKNKTQNNELEQLRLMIEMEAAQRNALEEYIRQLKQEVLQRYNPVIAEEILLNDAKANDEVVDAPLPAPGVLDIREEFMELQARLTEERNERERLKAITDSLEKERRLIDENEDDGFYALPNWIKEVGNNQNSTLRKVRAYKEVKEPEYLPLEMKIEKFELIARIEELSATSSARCSVIKLEPEPEVKKSNTIHKKEKSKGKSEIDELKDFLDEEEKEARVSTLAPPRQLPDVVYSGSQVQSPLGRFMMEAVASPKRRSQIVEVPYNPRLSQVASPKPERREVPKQSPAKRLSAALILPKVPVNELDISGFSASDRFIKESQEDNRGVVKQEVVIDDQELSFNQPMSFNTRSALQDFMQDDDHIPSKLTSTAMKPKKEEKLAVLSLDDDDF